MRRPLYTVPWMTDYNKSYMVYVQNHGPVVVSINEKAINTIMQSEHGHDCEIYVRYPRWVDGNLIESTLSDMIEFPDLQPRVEEGLCVYLSDMMALKDKHTPLHGDIAATILWDYDGGHIIPKRFIITSKYTWAGFNYGNVLMDTHALQL